MHTQTLASARSADRTVASAADRAHEVRLIGAARTWVRDAEIFAEGDPADQVYKVVSGGVREIRRLADGRRQITAFHLAGDVFGVELGATHRCAAEALGETVLLVARRSTLNSEQGERLWRLALRDLHRSQEHVLTLGRRAASERVAHMLLELAERQSGGGRLDLPMSRQDMADYLGLTIETVSRTLTQLQARGLIGLSGRRDVALARPATLAELCD